MYEKIISDLERAIYKQAGREFHIKSESEFIVVEKRLRVPAELINLRNAYFLVKRADELHRLKER